MIKNYIKTAFRNLKTHVAFSFINILGLSIGMACSILILLWVQDELKYDKWHSKRDRIDRILLNDVTGGGSNKIAVTPAALAPNVKKDFPEIEHTCRFKNWGPWLFRYKEGEYIQANSGAIDSTAFAIFDFAFIDGDPNTALCDAHSVVLTEEAANRIFGKVDNIVGEVLDVRGRGAFKVTGVIENVDHSHFNFEFLFPFHVLKEDGENIEDMGQGSYNFTTYILLKNENARASVNEKLKVYLQNFSDEEVTSEFFSQPLPEIYLKSNFAYDFTIRGDINNVITFTAIAFLVLLIACINFMNLTTARSGNRAKEIGLRKVVGGHRESLIAQFFGESIFMAALSFIIALVLVVLLLPKFNDLSMKELSISFIFDPSVLGLLISVALVTGIIAGSYPALFLSAFNPIKVLKGSAGLGAKSSVLRKVLVIIQFTLSVALIVSTILISQQLKFIKNKDLGYNKEHLIYTFMSNNIKQNYETFKQQLLANPKVEAVSYSRVVPRYACPSMTLREWEGMVGEQRLTMHFFPVGYDFFKVMQIEMSEGRFFDEEIASDSVGIVLNQEAIKQMGMENPIGKTVTLFGVETKIIGVMKDFNFNNVRNKIAPLLLFMNPPQARICFMRINPQDAQNTIGFIEETWNEFEPDSEFNYNFMDETLANLYRAEERSNTLITYFTIFAIFISCLGIFGLASFLAEQKTKEIGIRKVMGAPVPKLVSMFTSEFTRLVIVGNILGWPIAWYAMNKWLDNFAYHTTLSWWMFAMAAVLSLVVVSATISYQSFKAANKNPAESLRYE